MVWYQSGLVTYEDGESYQEFSSHSLPIVGRKQRRHRGTGRATNATTRITTATGNSLAAASKPIAQVDVLAAQVVVLELQCLEEVPQTVRALQQRQIVVLNLIQLNAEQAQRAVDFVAGAVYFLQGNQQRLGAAMFLLTPQYVQLSTADWQMQSEGVRQS